MTTPHEDPAVAITKFSFGLEYADISAPVIEMAKHSILDTFAVAIAGSSQAGVRESLDVMLASGGSPEATVWLFGDRLPADRAAFANGPMARALDMGDVHEEGGHVGEYILPALLAAAEIRLQRNRPVTGRELLVAYVAGAETLARVGLACRAITTGFDDGKNPQMGTFGAVVAVAKILDFDLPTTQNALGIAYSAMGSLDSQMYLDGTLMQRVHHGFVCRDAIVAALLAEKGVTGPHNIFTGQGNFFQMFYPNFRDPVRITDELGRRWEFAEGNMIKPYMCCKCFHSSMYALDLLLKENNIAANEIEEIRVVVPPMVYFTTANYAPRTMVDRQMSAPWSLAHIALHGELFLQSYEGQDSPGILDLMPKVHFEFDDTQSVWQGRVSVRVGERRFHRRVDYCVGHPKNPVDWPWLTKKLAQCSHYAINEFNPVLQERLVETIKHLEGLASVRDLITIIS